MPRVNSYTFHSSYLLTLLLSLTACNSFSYNLPANLSSLDASTCSQVNLESSSQAHQLLQAIATGNSQELDRLLDSDVNVNFEYTNRLTPLHLAVYSGQQEIMMKLLEKGAKVNQQDCYGNTPLHYAAFALQPNLVQILLDKGADFSNANLKGDTALHFVSALPPKLLHLALESKNSTALLIRLFPYAEQFENSYRSLEKLQRDKEMVLNKLLLAGANVNQLNSQQESPLQYATRAKDIASIRFLINHKADYLLRDQEGSSLLHELALGALPINALINPKPLLNPRTGLLEHFSQMDYEGTQEEIIEIIHMMKSLSERGLDLYAKDNYGLNVMHRAALTGQAEILDYVLDSGLDPNLPIQAPPRSPSSTNHEINFKQIA